MNEKEIAKQLRELADKIDADIANKVKNVSEATEKKNDADSKSQIVFPGRKGVRTIDPSKRAI